MEVVITAIVKVLTTAPKVIVRLALLISLLLNNKGFEDVS
jgi:hypothetical protein